MTGAVAERIDQRDVPQTWSEAERNARVELAALYRLLEMHCGLGDGIYTHVTLRIPDQPDHMLIKRHELLFREVTASNLVRVEIGADVDERAGVNRGGVVLHSGALSSRVDINCAIHVHTDAGVAFSAHAGGLRMMTQNAARFWRRVGYHDYEGLVVDRDEADRVAKALDPDNVVLILRNHGLLVVADTVRNAFERTRDLLIAARTQLMLEATGAPILDLSKELCDIAADQWREHDKERGLADWPAWKRLLEPGYEM